MMIYILIHIGIVQQRMFKLFFRHLKKLYWQTCTFSFEGTTRFKLIVMADKDLVKN